jgi:hypothetical protein
MGLFNEIIGAVVAVEALEKVDPNASLLTEGIAAFAGYEGVEAVTNHFAEKEATPAPAADDSADQADQPA